MESRTQMVVATLYQLARLDGNKFEADLSMAKPKRTDLVIDRLYAEEINDTSTKCGKYYKMDEQKTSDFYSKLNEKKKARAAQAQFDKLNNNMQLKDILNLINSSGVQESVQEPVQEAKVFSSDIPTIDNSIEEIKAYLDSKDIGYHHALKDKERLLELI